LGPASLCEICNQLQASIIREDARDEKMASTAGSMKLDHDRRLSKFCYRLPSIAFPRERGDRIRRLLPISCVRCLLRHRGIYPSRHVRISDQTVLTRPASQPRTPQTHIPSNSKAVCEHREAGNLAASGYVLRGARRRLSTRSPAMWLRISSDEGIKKKLNGDRTGRSSRGSTVACRKDYELRIALPRRADARLRDAPLTLRTRTADPVTRVATCPQKEFLRPS